MDTGSFHNLEKKNRTYTRRLLKIWNFKWNTHSKEQSTMSIHASPPRCSFSNFQFNLRLIQWILIASLLENALAGEIHITGLYPMSRDIEVGKVGRGVLPALNLAVDMLNNPKGRDQRKILQGHKLILSKNDTQCKMAVGLQAFFESLGSGPPKFMIFGGACPSVTTPIAESVHFWNIVQLSYANTTPRPRQKKTGVPDKNLYPNFYSTVPSENDIGAARIKLFQLFNWTKVATIHQNTPRFILAQATQVDLAVERGINITAKADFAHDPLEAVEKINSSRARIIMGFFSEAMARKVFCHVYKQKLYGRTYVWLLPGLYSNKWWTKADNSTDCTPDQLHTALKGYIGTDILPLSTRSEKTISGWTPAEYETLYNGQRGNEYSVFHGYAYDGVWVMAKALDKVLRTLKETNDEASFWNFDYKNRTIANLLIQAMNETNFMGVTGPVQFRGGERLGCTMHKQLQDHDEVKVAEYYAVTDSLNLTDEFIWIGGHAPKDEIEMIVRFQTVSKVTFVLTASIAFAGILMAIGFLTFNMKHRNQRYIKMSSPFLNNLIILGGILTYSSVFLLGMDRGTMGSSVSLANICKARAWCMCIGFTLSFGAMFSKTWRVHRIFTNIKMKRKVIKDHQLFAIVGVLLVVDLVILVTWEIVDSLHDDVKEVYKETSDQPEEMDVLYIYKLAVCESRNTMIWLAIIYAYKGVLLIFGLFLAWETRHVSIPALNDSKYIGMSVYNVTIMCCLGVALSFVIQDNPAASHGLISVFILFCATITLSLVFVPKVIELRINPHANERIRVVGGLDKARSTPGNAASITSSAKVRIIAEENSDLRKKLVESDKKIKELEDELYRIAPEEAPLLLKLDSDSDIPSMSPSKSNGGTKRINLSPNSVYYQPSNTSNPSSQVETKVPNISDEEEPSKELYENYGGVWIGPPGAEDNPDAELIPYEYPYDLNQNGSFQDSVAEVHRTYDDTVPLKTPDNSPVRGCAITNNIPQSPYEMPAFLIDYTK
ncbi:gamma-aminobutyric acid type B receptor subunit 2-like isoform X2 [Apostichopus japonicus]|uniref:gamma-aminobutyric acid type B receptor subunit 2-like isoform X2 n=1 Tax=Stichopus japonicus TaxID=307972 RepID=UPI003AB684D2